MLLEEIRVSEAARTRQVRQIAHMRRRFGARPVLSASEEETEEPVMEEVSEMK